MGNRFGHFYEELSASYVFRNDPFDGLSLCQKCYKMDEIEGGEEWDVLGLLIGSIFFQRSASIFSDQLLLAARIA